MYIIKYKNKYITESPYSNVLSDCITKSCLWKSKKAATFEKRYIINFEGPSSIKNFDKKYLKIIKVEIKELV